MRGKLLRWLLLPLGTVWLVDALDTYLRTQRTVNSAYDRALYGSVLSISERISLVGGRPVVDIPPVALDVLDTEAQERVFYRVAYRVGDGPEIFLTGYPDLPAPRGEALPIQPEGLDERLATAGPGTTVGADAVAGLATDAPLRDPAFDDMVFRGDPVRVASLRRRIPTAPPIEVLVQVAETLGGRSQLRRAAMARELSFQLTAILCALGAVWLGITRGLRPLRRLSRDVTSRDATDLAPLPLEEVPREVVPVVEAVNGLMQRLRETLSEQQRFIADASHALRTPLAVLRSEADLALRLTEPADLRRAVVQLRDHVQATSHLASQLLTLARVGRHGDDAPSRRLDLAATAREACSALVPAALERQADLGYAGEAAGPLPVLGREQELREAIGNLVDNALRYGRPGGTVTVSARREGERAVLAVEDDGPGIGAEDLEQVLQPFHRLPGSPGDGSGLGLAIVKEIADGHGAPLLLLRGSGGRGLRVELRLPALPDESSGATGS
jgi:two-component system sensor histidine kinase TctE